MTIAQGSNTVRDFPVGATACGPGRRVPACGPPGSRPGQAGHSSRVPGGPWLTSHALTGSSRQMLLGRRDDGAGRRRVRFGPEPNWKRGQWGPGLARGTEGNRPHRRPGPGSGPAGRRALPKREDMGSPGGSAHGPPVPRAGDAAGLPVPSADACVTQTRPPAAGLSTPTLDLNPQRSSLLEANC